MADTLTPNYKWVQPDVGGDPTTWGTTVNTDLGLIDAQVYANAQAAVPIGAITMFAGATPPTNWLMCDGTVYPNTAIPLLAPILNNLYNAGTAAVAGTSSAVPNLVHRLPYGAGGADLGGQGGTTAGNFSFTIGPTQIPAHTHPVSDPQHYHVVAAYTHTHGVSDPTHAHGASQDNHTHSVTLPGSFGGGVGPQVPPSPLVNQGSDGLTTSGASASGVYISAAATGISIAAATTGIPNTNYAATGIAVRANTGGGAAVTFVPPILGINFIIRYQ